MSPGRPDVPRRSAPSLRRGAALAASSALLVLTGCSEPAAEAEGHDTGTDREEGGPLSATLDVGGNAVTAPGVSPWHVSFGHYVLCSREPGVEITVEDVALADVPAQPRGVEVLVRTVSPDDFPTSGAIPTPLQPFYSARGSAPDFREPYADPAAAGSYTTEVAGTKIEQTCDETKGRVEGYKELVFTFEVGDEGSRVDAFTIDYSADGRPYRLRVPWNMVACGTAIVEKDICS